MNRCDTCRILAVTDCPLLDKAYQRGFDGMTRCEMADAVEKVYQAVRSDPRGRREGT